MFTATVSIGGAMIEVADIQKDLPDWPQDIIEQWLHYFANEPDGGWPPPDPLGESRWKGLFGGRALSWWKNVTWVKAKMICEPANLSPKARAGVNEVLAEVSKKEPDAVTKRRFSHAYIYIMDHGVFPRALVTMRPAAGAILLDGTHRMAAFEMLQRTPDAKFAQFGKKKAALEQEVWIGTHAAGEYPLT